jgi:hypothetical protein
MRALALLALALSAASVAAQGEVQLSLPDVTVRPGAEVVVPVTVETPLAGRDVRAFTVVVRYASAAVTPVAVETDGTLVDGLSVEAEIDEMDREVRVAAAAASPLTGSGVLFRVRFRGEAPGSVTLSFDPERSVLNQGEPALAFTDGRVTVETPPTVRLGPPEAVLLTGETATFTASGGAAPYTYETDDPAVATVDGDGLVTAVAPGTTRLRAFDADGTPSTDRPLVDVRAFSLSTEPVEVGQGETVRVPLATTSLDGLGVRSGEVTLRLTASVARIAGVETDGTLLDGVSTSAQTEGDVTRIAFASADAVEGAGTLLTLVVEAAADGNGNAALQAPEPPAVNEGVLGLARGLGSVRVSPPPTLGVSPSSSEILAGETVALAASGAEGAVSWASSDAAVAAVSDAGVVTGVGSGTAAITATDAETGGTGTAAVTVFGVEVDLGEVETGPGQTVRLPVAFRAPAGEAVESIQGRLRFSGGGLLVADVDADDRLADGWSLSANALDDGVFAFAGAGPAVSSGGVFLDLVVVVSPRARSGVQTAEMLGLLFNEGVPTARALPGAVTVTGGNAPPTATDDAASVDEDGTVLIDVLDNDADPDGDALTIESVGAPRFGTAEVEDGQVRYTPDPDANGEDQFTYQASDGAPPFAQATVTVTVAPVNDPPVAAPDVAATAPGEPVTVPVLDNDTDAEDDALTVTAVSTPASGTATITDDGQSVTYTPDDGFEGADAFTYTVSDGNGGEATGTVDVRVGVGNAPPVARDDEAATDDATPVTVAVLANDADADGDALAVTAVGTPSRGAASTDGTTVTYTPEAPGPYTATFTYTLSDGQDDATAAVTVTVSAAGRNTPPTARDDDASVAPGAAVQIAVLANDADADGDALTVTAVGTPEQGTASTDGTTVTYTAQADADGLDTFPYTVSDGVGGTATATVRVTVMRGVPAVTSAPAAPPAAGQPSTVTVGVEGLVPVEADLFYRVTGRTDYASVPLVPAGEAYQAEVPAGAVTPRGYDYYVRLSDGETTLTDPAVDPASAPRHVRVATAAQTSAVVVPRDGTYRMVSVPVALDAAAPEAVFADDLGPYAPSRWRLLRWDPAAEAYDELGGSDAPVVPGRGYWLAARGEGEVAFDVEAGRSVDASAPVEIVLPPGWSQIGVPFAFPVAWADVAGAEDVPPPVAYDGVEYVPGQTAMAPWQGLFVENPTDAPVTISVPPIEAEADEEARQSGARLGRATYALQIAATAGDRLRDTHNVVGFAEGATDARDVLDWGEPPPVGPHVRLSVVEGGARLARSLRPPSAEGAAWDVEVAASPDAVASGPLDVALALDDLAPLPDGFGRWVLDLDRGAALPVVGGRARLALEADDPAARLRVIVGTEAFAQSAADGASLTPDAFSLEAPRPNPAAGPVRLDYVLAAPAEVRLEVFDAVGRRVAVVAEGERDAGVWTSTWTPSVAAGVYLVRFRAGAFQAVRPLTVVR